MKILLLGEYSALHKYLKDGLQVLGHDVKLASDGDWGKKIPGMDFPLTIQKPCNRFVRYYYDAVEPLLNKNFYGYDVAQIISANSFDWKNRLRIYKKLMRDNKKFFCLVAGDDYYVYRAWQEDKLRYCSFKDNEPWTSCWIGDTKAHKLNEECYNYVLKHSRGVIPANPYMEIPYAGWPNLTPYIPLPVNTDEIRYQPNVIKNGKIVFYHGATRPLDKGSAHIIEAMKYLESKYPNDVECIVKGLIPYTEWLEVMSRANVIVDDCQTYTYGMTAIISMARGKVVLSGLEPEDIPYIKTPDCPVYNLIPDTGQIIRVLEEVVAEKKNLEEIGFKGRLFAEQEHGYIKVAKQYLDVWNQ